MHTIEKRLAELGFALPAATSAANYVLARRVGDLVFTAGQGPFSGGTFRYIGQVGKEVTDQEGYEAARLCALNCLAAFRSVLKSLDEIDEFVNLRVFVNCTEDFVNHPEVADGASDLLVKAFGAKGRHSRSTIGVSSLPRGISVEVEAIAKVK